MSIRYHGSVQRQDEISALTIAVNACNRSSPLFGVATWAPSSEGGAGCLWPYLLEVNEFTVPIYGCISPIFVLLTILTNFLVCLVLVKKHMRSPTNVILVAMAISDTLTGVWPIPCFVYFYALNRHHDYVPYEWCFAYFCLTEYLPTIFHTASIWLTVALAAQRYVYVCVPAHAKRLCTIPNIVKVIVGIYLFAVASQLCRFAEYEYFPVDVPSRDVGFSGRLRRACYYDFTPLIHRHQNLYFNLYYWFRIVFIHFVPCTSLVILNLALILAMRSAQRRRGALLQTATSGYDCARVMENNSTTLMLVTVVGVSLLVELPLAFLIIVVSTENTFNVQILADQTSYSASLFLNMFILISYPFNFFIYCGMSQQFRRTFRSLFLATTSGPVEGGEHHGPYLSIAVRVPASAGINDTPL